MIAAGSGWAGLAVTFKQGFLFRAYAGSSKKLAKLRRGFRLKKSRDLRGRASLSHIAG